MERSDSTPNVPDWRLIRAFVAVMQEGTLSGAARRLGTTQPTVGRQIRALEDATGDVLFLRRGTRFEPTPLARDLFPRAFDVERAVLSLGHAFAGGEEQQGARPVRLTLPTLLADELLPRILPDLGDAVPDATFEILPSDHVQDLHRRDADIALRLVAPSQPDLIARRIGAVSIGFHGTRAYLERHGHPATTRELSNHALIVPANQAEVAMATADLDFGDWPPARLFQSDDLRHQMALVRAGLGIGPCHDWIARLDANLVRVLPGTELLRLDLWLVATDDIRRSRVLRRVAELTRRFIATD